MAAVMLSILTGSLILALIQLAGTVPLAWQSPGGGWQLGLNLDFGGSPVSLVTIILAGLFVTLPLSALPGLLFGLAFSRPVGRRIKTLASAMEGLAGGSWQARAPVSSTDELGQLAVRFNLMADQLDRLTRENARLAAQEERTRMLRDLHDGIKQNLFSMGLAAGTALNRIDHDPAAAALQMERIKSLNAEAMRELSELFGALPTGGNTSLRTVVDTTVKRFGVRSSLPVIVGDLPECPLDAAAAEILKRVLQESLTNAGKHSGGSKIRLSAALSGKELTLSVSDNGSGLKPGRDPFTAGTGLQGMRDRLGAVGGSLAIENRDGGGVMLTVVLNV
jgi:NarL family two-component system sensor histidine kinase LiaS